MLRVASPIKCVLLTSSTCSCVSAAQLSGRLLPSLLNEMFSTCRLASCARALGKDGVLPVALLVLVLPFMPKLSMSPCTQQHNDTGERGV